MKLKTAIVALCALFSAVTAAGQSTTEPVVLSDTLSSTYLYTEGIKKLAIERDNMAAHNLFRRAIALDSLHAPSLFALSSNGLCENEEEAVDMARRAYRIDSTNRWYHGYYGYALITAGRYREALGVYRKLQTTYPKEPDNYRLLAALYEATNDPYMALAVLDSAEMRFGRIGILSRHKRHLLITTRQLDKALEEAQAMVEETPYDRENRVVLAEMYALNNKDSLAQAEYEKALKIDSASVETLLSMSDFYASKQRFGEMLATTQRLYELPDYPLEGKISRFRILTSDIHFYRRYYPQLNALASTLAVRYPDDSRVVMLYGGHLIASGEMEQALVLYKLHLDNEDIGEELHLAVIDMEIYSNRPDSALRYIRRAQSRYPESVTFYLSEGGLHHNEGNFNAEYAAYRRALKHAKSDSVRSVIWGTIGDAFHSQSEKAAERGGKMAASDARMFAKRSYKAYDKSLKLWSDNVLVMNNYAYFLAEEGRDLERALGMSSRVVELTDKNPTYLDTHAWVLYRLGRYAEAKRVIQQAVAFDTRESAELLVHYGDILDALGEHFSAEIYWRKALEKGYDKAAIERRIEERKKEKR